MSELQTTKEETIRIIRDEFPRLLRSDSSSARTLAITREHFPSKVETEDRFTRILNELARDREEQNRKWEEQNRKWEEQNRKWQESNQRFDEAHKEIMAQAKKFDRSIGALGSRWGLQTERAFRDALAGILVESFGVEVVNVNEFDDEGEVFGKPDQVELDIIIRNGLLIICELKSSMDKPAMYTFERKVRFYEKRHQRKANRMIVISPMIEERARRVGKKLGIEMYADSLNAPVA
uniref:DUF3782 domain-containing protein n=1 Tax=Candidatus Kentrum sp. TC TaxID=2126339 RepID=A0A450ZBK5_9GAMM|nr:MAG: hypothetical protein BECKTC1821D_GA0114238_11296 [Candidatus Kentron sp. TC]